MLYRMLDHEAGIKSLLHRELKLGNALEFNDPYDSLLALEHPDDRIPINKLQEAADNQRREQFKNYGIICLSEKPESTCLWSHYTNKHTGIALGFDLKTDGDSIFKIKYLKERPTLDISKDLIDSKTKEQIIECLITKSVDWTYEAEYRVILPLSHVSISKKKLGEIEVSFIPMPPQLKEVILGCNSPESVEVEIRNIIKSNYADSIKIKRAHLSPNTFDMIIKDA